MIPKNYKEVPGNPEQLSQIDEIWRKAERLQFRIGDNEWLIAEVDASAPIFGFGWTVDHHTMMVLRLASGFEKDLETAKAAARDRMEHFRDVIKSARQPYSNGTD